MNSPGDLIIILLVISFILAICGIILVLENCALKRAIIRNASLPPAVVNSVRKNIMDSVNTKYLLGCEIDLLSDTMRVISEEGHTNGINLHGIEIDYGHRKIGKASRVLYNSEEEVIGIVKEFTERRTLLFSEINKLKAIISSYEFRNYKEK